MKRFHVHIAVDYLADSIGFYTRLFGQAPVTVQSDYAKWMLEDPRVNFAISARGHTAGVNHFGFQADSTEELQNLKQLAISASEGQLIDQGETACCYARSEKHWTVDPQGLAWEHFHTMSEVQKFGTDMANQSGACCVPTAQMVQNVVPDKMVCAILETNSARIDSCCNKSAHE